jgi:hypothetical protein
MTTIDTKNKWAGHRLLVPIGLDALVRTNIGNGTDFSDESKNFDAYKDYGKINPAPFTVSQRPKPGIHLKWALPDGLTNASAAGDEEHEYPLVPNRWMVIRFSQNYSYPRRVFIVESDYIGDGPKKGEDGVVTQDGHSEFLYEKSEGLAKGYLGRWFDYEDEDNAWHATESTSKLFLTATGIGDPTFAASTANSKFVFHFHDEPDSNSRREYSYMVTGWYSDRESDPLHPPAESGYKWESKEDWLAVLEKLGWSVGNEDELSAAVGQAKTWTDEFISHQTDLELDLDQGDYPTQSLYHGYCLSVEWPGWNRKSENSIPRFNLLDVRDTPKVVVANTGMDGLATLLDWQLNHNAPAGWTPQAEDGEVRAMLQALSHRMLSKMGTTVDVAELKDAVHNATFGSKPGGLVWMIKYPESKGGHDPNVSGAHPVLPPAIAEKLDKLNSSQEGLNRASREKEAQQELLYMNWWKQSNNTADRDDAKINAGVAAVAALDQTISQAEVTISEKTRELRELLTLKNLDLVSKPAPKFFQPNDPSLLISGVRRSYKWGEDSRFSEGDDQLLVRFTGQSLSNITALGSVILGADLSVPFLDSDTHIPKEIPALFAEAMLIDTDFARKIGWYAKGSVEPTVAEIQTIQTQQTYFLNTAALEELTNANLNPAFNLSNNGKVLVPSVVAVNHWAPPWNPISLRWRVRFYPRTSRYVEHDPTHYTEDLTSWTFNGQDYSSNDLPDLETDDEYKIFEGNTELTPKDSFALHAQLEKFKNDNAGKLSNEGIAWQDLLHNVKNLDVLSQAFSSFGDQLIQRDTEQFTYIPRYGNEDTIKNAIGEQGQGILHNPASGAAGFFPIRAGFLKIDKLWITDEFGQIFSVLDQGTLGNELSTIPGTGLVPNSDTLNAELPQFIQLPPRFVQPARLELNFINDYKAQESAVQGWFVPNHVNRNLLVYDPDGYYQGQFYLAGEIGSKQLYWRLEEGATLRSQMALFVEGLLNHDDPVNSFQDFMKTIDETQWGVIPTDNRDQVNLSIMVGHPVAMVTAKYSFGVYGDFVQRMDGTHSKQAAEGNVSSQRFPLQIGNRKLGNDGVIGYFGPVVQNASAYASYHQFIAVDQLQAGNSGAAPYVQHEHFMIKPDSSTSRQDHRVTILLDPRGKIHTYSGILPVLETALPEEVTAAALKNMQLDFNMGPVLLHEDLLQLNIPSGVGNAWTWFQPDQVNGELNWNSFPNIAMANATATLPVTPPEIKQGRLRLTGALGRELLIFFFEATGEGVFKNEEENLYEVSAGVKPILRWSTQSATSVSWNSVNCNPKGAKTLELHASAFIFESAIEQNTMITLFATNDANDSKSITITLKAVQ